MAFERTQLDGGSKRKALFATGAEDPIAALIGRLIKGDSYGEGRYVDPDSEGGGVAGNFIQDMLQESPLLPSQYKDDPDAHNRVSPFANPMDKVVNSLPAGGVAATVRQPAMKVAQKAAADLTKKAAARSAERAAKASSEKIFQDVSKSLVGEPAKTAAAKTVFNAGTKPGPVGIDEVLKKTLQALGIASAGAGVGTLASNAVDSAEEKQRDRQSGLSLSDLVTGGASGASPEISASDEVPSISVPNFAEQAMSVPAQDAPVEEEVPESMTIPATADDSILKQLMELQTQLRGTRQPDVTVPERKKYSGLRGLVQKAGDAGVAFSRGYRGDLDVNREGKDQLAMQATVDAINQGRKGLDPIDASTMNLLQNMMQTQHGVQSSGAEQERLMKAGVPIKQQEAFTQALLDIMKMQSASDIGAADRGTPTQLEYNTEIARRKTDQLIRQIKENPFLRRFLMDQMGGGQEGTGEPQVNQ